MAERYWFRTKDHPAASGRKPKSGDKQWSFDFVGENGLTFKIYVGEETRARILKMLDADQVQAIPDSVCNLYGEIKNP